MMASPQAKAVVLNFDAAQIAGTGLAPMPNSGGSIPSTARLSNQFLSSSGIVFSPFVALVDVETTAPESMPSPTNGIGGVSTNNTVSYATPILASFFLPANSSTPAITDFVSVQADFFGEGGSISLQAFNTQGTLIGSTSAVDSGGPILSLSIAGIHSVRIEGTSGSAFDNFTFNDVVADPSASVPEPSTLLGLGLLGLGAAFKRRF